MSRASRRAPARLLETLQGRVDDLGERLVGVAAEFNHSFEVDVDRVAPDPDQARKVFSDKELDELAGSLRDQGQLQPILVRPVEGKRGWWIIVAGERRWRAARKAGIQRLLAIERSSDHELASLTENLQRADLHPVEEAVAVLRLSERLGVSQRDLAKRLGKSASDVNGMLSVARLPEETLQAVLNSEQPLARNLLIELARLPDGPERRDMLGDALRGNLRFSDVRRRQDQGNPDGKGEGVPTGKSREATALPHPKRLTARLSELNAADLTNEMRSALQALRNELNRLLD